MATVEFNLVQDWGTGFEGEITLVNDGSMTYENWELEFTADFEITSLWNADIVNTEGNRHIIRFKDWNPDLDIGETISFGFNGIPSDTGNNEPADYLLNGQPLDGGGGVTPLPRLSVDNISITEGDNGVSYANYTVSLNQASGEDITVDYSTSDGTATAGEDYLAVNDTLTFGAGETSKTISVVINGDRQWENDETFSLNLSNANGTDIADSQGLTTILNDDQNDPVIPPTSSNGIIVNFVVDSQWETGFSGSLTITNQGNTPIDDWQIEFDSPFEITSLWDAQIDSSSNGTYTVSDLGWNGTINPNATVSFGFNGSYDGTSPIPAPTNYVFNGELLGDYPAISVNDVSVTETDNGNALATFSVNLSSASDQTITVEFETADGSAVEGVDYLDTSGTLTFAPNETSQTVTVEITPDTVYEGNENFFLNLSNPTQGNLRDSQGIATIVENDAMPASLTIDNLSINEGDQGINDAIFTVTLSEVSDQVITVAYETQDGSAFAGSDYQAVAGNLTFNPGETTKNISVGINGDTIVEANQSFYLNLSSPTNAILSDGQAKGTILNDDVGGNGNSDYVVGAYYPEWAIYDRDFQVEDIPADKLTHVFYAFAKIDDNGEVDVFDPWAATQTTFGGKYTWEQSQNGEAGNFAELQALKEENPHLKNMISIGGWTLSDSFSDVALTDANREKFASSAVEFMVEYDFDGIDVDWEYPVSGGLASNTYRPEDKENYTLLLGELREQLDAQSALDGNEYELTIAAPAGNDKIVNYDLAGMSEHLDFINVMTYDYHGSWENTTNHQAALYANPNDPSDLKDTYNISSTIEQYLDAGVPADELVLGAPIYGRSWTGVPDVNDGLFQSATGAGPGTWENGIFDYKDLYDKVNDPNSGYELFWDDIAQVPYVYNESLGVFSTYENPQSLGSKLDYLQEQGLGGMFFWEASGDLNANNPDSLINIAATELAVVV